jgi:aspartate-semialdehyde dehydrogenase
MSERINVGIAGATGMVGQYYVHLLQNHPWFKVTYVAASPKSAGKKYADAVAGRWHAPGDIPEDVRDLTVADANDVTRALGRCAVVFSAIDLDKNAVRELESNYALKGFAVISNNSAHRSTSDVPMIIPEINPGHADIIPAQRKNHGFSSGLIAVKSNCSIQSFMTPVHALIRAGYPIRRMIVSTMQALSGAGYPGPSGLDVIDNVVPYIGGEEEKSENEPLKIFGSIENGRIAPAATPLIAAHCNRVPVVHGHTACVSLEFEREKPTLDAIMGIWREFKAAPQELGLPSAPRRPIIYRSEVDRPQPRKDRDAQGAMAVTVGRLRKCPVFDIRFVGLHHNTVRGAAGGCILTAELLKAKGYIG